MKFDAIIIGAGAAGITAALVLRNTYPDKRLLVLKSIPNGVIPCAIPYMFTKIKPAQNALPTTMLEDLGAIVKAERVKAIDRETKSVLTDKGRYEYEKLLIATGSEAAQLPIPGFELENVFTIKKDLDELSKLDAALKRAKRVLLLGGGFIGVEFADALSATHDVTVVELDKELLPTFDPEFGAMAHDLLAKAGVTILTGVGVQAIEGSGKAERVLLSDGKRVETDLVIVGVGVRAQSGLALAADLEVTPHKAIKVNPYQQTSDPDIYAVGDCAAKRDFVTGKPGGALLASVATAEARIAAVNMFGGKVKNEGSIAAYVTSVTGVALGSVGLSEHLAAKEGVKVLVAEAKAQDRHPGVLPGAQLQRVRLVANTKGVLVGGAVVGGNSVGELVNALALAVKARLPVKKLAFAEVATQPLLTASPVAYPVINAALALLKQL